MAANSSVASNKPPAYDYLIKLLLIGDSGLCFVCFGFGGLCFLCFLWGLRRLLGV